METNLEVAKTKDGDFLLLIESVLTDGSKVYDIGIVDGHEKTLFRTGGYSKADAERRFSLMKQALAFSVETEKASHYFASNQSEWCCDTDIKKLKHFMRCQEQPFAVWFVPLPLDAHYEIVNYRPNVEGIKLIEHVEYSEGLF